MHVCAVFDVIVDQGPSLQKKKNKSLCEINESGGDPLNCVLISIIPHFIVDNHGRDDSNFMS